MSVEMWAVRIDYEKMGGKDAVSKVKRAFEESEGTAAQWEFVDWSSAYRDEDIANDLAKELTAGGFAIYKVVPVTVTEKEKT